MGYKLTVISSALGVSRSTYYKHMGRGEDKGSKPVLDEKLAKKIRAPYWIKKRPLAIAGYGLTYASKKRLR